MLVKIYEWYKLRKHKIRLIMQHYFKQNINFATGGASYINIQKSYKVEEILYSTQKFHKF